MNTLIKVKVQGSNLNLISVMSRDREQAAVSEGPLDFTPITSFHELPELWMSVWGNKAQKKKKQGERGFSGCCDLLEWGKLNVRADWF